MREKTNDCKDFLPRARPDGVLRPGSCSVGWVMKPIKTPEQEHPLMYLIWPAGVVLGFVLSYLDVFKGVTP
jgi:hypothetical protein